MELEDGTIVKMEAQKYVDALKAEAEMLRKRLGKTKDWKQSGTKQSGSTSSNLDQLWMASRQGDMKSLTKGMSPDILRTMDQLVHFVVMMEQEHDQSKRNGNDHDDDDDDDDDDSSATPVIPKTQYTETELPSSALRQLALWQMVLGYKLREEEAKGDYLEDIAR